jgi:hypothetical protein
LAATTPFSTSLPLHLYVAPLAGEIKNNGSMHFLILHNIYKQFCSILVPVKLINGVFTSFDYKNTIFFIECSFITHIYHKIKGEEKQNVVGKVL